MGKVKEEMKDTGKVKEGMKDMGKGKVGVKGEGRAWGRSEGGWILGKDGRYRVDPKWVSENKDAQPSSDIWPTPVIDMPESDIVGAAFGSVRDAPPAEKAKRAKTKGTKVSTGTTVFEKLAMSHDGQVGGLARARAAMEAQGYGLFPVRFNTLYKTSGDPAFQAAIGGLQQCQDGTYFKLKTTKTFKFVHVDSSEVSWEAIKLAKPSSSYLPQNSETTTKVTLDEKGTTGTPLPDAPVPTYNSKMSKERKEELKCRKEAFESDSFYLKSWPEKQARTGKSKCGFWGRKRSRKEKAKKEQEMAVKEEMTKSKAKKEFWSESWKRKKEEKARLADEREEEEMAREREKHLLLVSPLDMDAQVFIQRMAIMTITITIMTTMIMMHHHHHHHHHYHYHYQ